MAWPSITRTSRVEWVDTDAAGHHHNTAIIRWVEAAEAELMRSCGLDDYFRAAPRVRYEADYTSRLYFGQEVSTVVVLERIGVTSMTFTFQVRGAAFNGREQVNAADGRFVTVHLPAGATAAQQWPASWLETLTER